MFQNIVILQQVHESENEDDKLKIEVKDPDEIKRLQKELNKKSVDYSNTMEEGTDDGEECILPKKVLKNFPKPKVYPA